MNFSANFKLLNSEDMDNSLNLFKKEIQDIKLDNHDGLIKRSEKIAELSKAITIIKDYVGKLESTLAEETEIVSKAFASEEEKIRKVKDTLAINIGQGSNKATIKETYKNPINDIGVKLPEGVRWGDMANDVLISPKINKPIVQTPVIQTGVKPIKREIAPGVYMNAFDIEKAVDCHKYKGYLCYCPTTERFYLSLNGEIIKGTTTVINPANEKPIKFHEHYDCLDGKQTDRDYKSTDYYIPRESNPSSRDVRQFTNKMKFLPASVKPDKQFDKYIYRLGSKATLREDLNCVQDSDLRLYHDMVSNYLLILLAALTEQRTKKYR